MSDFEDIPDPDCDAPRKSILGSVIVQGCACNKRNGLQIELGADLCPGPHQEPIKSPPPTPVQHATRAAYHRAEAPSYLLTRSGGRSNLSNSNPTAKKVREDKSRGNEYVQPPFEGSRQDTVRDTIPPHVGESSSHRKHPPEHKTQTPSSDPLYGYPPEEEEPIKHRQNKFQSRYEQKVGTEHFPTTCEIRRESGRRYPSTGTQQRHPSRKEYNSEYVHEIPMGYPPHKVQSKKSVSSKDEHARMSTIRSELRGNPHTNVPHGQPRSTYTQKEDTIEEERYVRPSEHHNRKEFQERMTEQAYNQGHQNPHGDKTYRATGGREESASKPLPNNEYTYGNEDNRRDNKNNDPECTVQDNRRDYNNPKYVAGDYNPGYVDTKCKYNTDSYPDYNEQRGHDQEEDESRNVSEKDLTHGHEPERESRCVRDNDDGRFNPQRESTYVSDNQRTNYKTQNDAAYIEENRESSEKNDSTYIEDLERRGNDAQRYVDSRRSAIDREEVDNRTCYPEEHQSDAPHNMAHDSTSQMQSSQNQARFSPQPRQSDNMGDQRSQLNTRPVTFDNSYSSQHKSYNEAQTMPQKQNRDIMRKFVTSDIRSASDIPDRKTPSKKSIAKPENHPEPSNICTRCSACRELNRPPSRLDVNRIGSNRKTVDKEPVTEKIAVETPEVVSQEELAPQAPETTNVKMQVGKPAIRNGRLLQKCECCLRNGLYGDSFCHKCTNAKRPWTSGHDEETRSSTTNEEAGGSTTNEESDPSNQERHSHGVSRATGDHVSADVGADVDKYAPRPHGDAVQKRALGRQRPKPFDTSLEEEVIPREPLIPALANYMYRSYNRNWNSPNPRSRGRNADLRPQVQDSNFTIVERPRTVRQLK